MKINQILWKHEESQIPFGEKYVWVEGYVGQKLLFVYHKENGKWYLNAGPTLMSTKVHCTTEERCTDLATEILKKFIHKMIEK